MPIYKYTTYCDESGEISFSKKSDYDYFLITAMTIKTEDEIKLIRTLKRKYSKLYNIGWPKDKEIKSTALHNLKWENNVPQNIKDNLDGDKFIEEIIQSLKLSCPFTVAFFIVKKSGIINPYFRHAPYGIAYNFFAGKLIPQIILKNESCLLIMDQRNKETHGKQCFDEYISTTLLNKIINEKTIIDFEIKHSESHSVLGLQAVDFLCWSIYRSILKKETRFLDLFIDTISEGIRWYI